MPAAGRLSTITLCPSFCASSLAWTSPPPPGGKGITRVIARVGKLPWAGAACMPRVLSGTAHQLSGANDVVAMRITDMGIPNAVSILKQREIQRFQQLGNSA